MQDIRVLLSQGKSTTEVIALGYKPPTVYKVQRQLRQKQQPDGRAPVQLMDQSISDREGQKELSAEDAEFFWCFFEPADGPAQFEALRAELDEARGRIEELEGKVGKVQVLQEKVHTLKAEAEAGIELRRRVQELERELERSSQTQADLRQSNIQWQSRFQAERSARQQAEQRVEEARVHTRQLQQEYQLLQSKLDASSQVIENLRADHRQLVPSCINESNVFSKCRDAQHSWSTQRVLDAHYAHQ
jgi:DNA repair exonuclease SbcCD ATPase subunit